MSGEKLLRLIYKAVEHIGCLGSRHPSILGRSTIHRLYHKTLPFTAGMVVRRRAGDILAPALDYEQMTVLYSGNEPNLVRTESGIKKTDKLPSIRGGKMTAMMIENLSIRQCDDIATHGHIPRLHVIAYTRGFQRASPLIDLGEIITEDGGIGHLAPWREPFRDSHEHPRPPFSRHAIKGRRGGIFKRRPTAERGYRMVTHAVTKYYQMFHQLLAVEIILAKTPAAVTAAPAPYPCMSIGYSR